MQFEYTLTFEEWQEASAPASSSSKPKEKNSPLVLKTIDAGTVLLPKRAVSDDRAMDEMKMLISENISEGAFIQKQQAFQVIVPSESSPVTTDK